MRKQRQTVLCTVLALAALVASIPVSSHADGGGGGDATSSRVVRLKPEDPDYTKATKAINAGDFAAAIPLLERVVARNSPEADAYNWLAYSIRRNGDPAGSLPIYQKALAIDPKHRGAHEYIGEAYLVLGDVSNAKEHLAPLGRLCFLPCSQYRDVKKRMQVSWKSAAKVNPTPAQSH